MSLAILCCLENPSTLTEVDYLLSRCVTGTGTRKDVAPAAGAAWLRSVRVQETFTESDGTEKADIL